MRKNRPTTFLAALFLLACFPLGLLAQLNGTYSINSGAPASATNYTTVASAISDLNAGTRADGGPVQGPGVSGPVTLRIAAGSGPYNEQVSIGAIAGASATNSVRLTGGPTRETIQFTGTTTADRHVIRLSGAKHVILDSLTIINNDPTNGYGVWLTSVSDSNFVTNNIVNVNATSTSTAFSPITISGATVAANGNFGNYNTITGNAVNGGYYGITCRGTSTTVYGQGNKINDNTITNVHYYGIYVYYQNLTEVLRNSVSYRASPSTTGYAIYLYYADRFRCERNRLTNLVNYGIYSLYGNYQGGSASTRAIIANNMVGGTWSGSTPYGIYLSTNCTNVDIVHNSVMVTSGNGRAIYITSGTGNTVVNNAVSYLNSTTAYGLYITSAANVSTVNYNDYWVPGSSNFVYIASAFTTATFVGGGGFNLNSINVDPGFTSVSNLHITSGTNLFNLGTNAGVTEDFDADPRPANGGYDIGADEFAPGTNDVGPTSMTNPVQPFSAGVQNVDIVLRNFGASVLTSASVDWTFDGIPQAPFGFVGSVAPGAYSTPQTLGTANFTAGVPHTLRFITSIPNASADANTSNDTLTVTVCSGMSGNYSIGGLGADFPTINSAVSALLCGGVSGPVTMHINAAAGPYNEQVIIPAIPGAVGANTVRFTGGAGMATIQFTGTTTNEKAVIKLNGAKRIILDSLTVINNDPTNGFGIHLTNNADSNVVRHSSVTVNSTSTSTLFAGIVIGGATATTAGDWGDFNTIEHNTIMGGYYGISMRGLSTTVFSNFNKINHNTINETYLYGIYCYSQNTPELMHNVINSRVTGSTTSYGIYIAYSDYFICNYNNLKRQGGYGIYLLYGNYQNGTQGGRATVANNMIGGGFRATSPYGIYMSTNCVDIDVHYNSVSLDAGNGRGIYVVGTTGSTGMDVRNNSFSVVNGVSGYAAYFASAANVSFLDYNNYWAPGSSNYVYVGVAYTPFTLPGSGGFNSNSLNADPYYFNASTDLHSYGATLYNTGINLPGILDDIDGDVRPGTPATNVDIGADEYIVDTLNARAFALLTPGNYTCPDSNQAITVIVFNQGFNAISNLPVTVNYTGLATGSFNAVLPGPVGFGEYDTLVVGTFNSWSGGTLNLEIITNLGGDQDNGNDTLRLSRVINLTPMAATPGNDTLCANDSTSFGLSPSSFMSYWYDSPVGGTQLASGDTLHTGPLATTTTYYVESRGLAPNSITTTFVGGNGCSGGNMFDIQAISNLTIDSLDLNLGATTLSSTSIYYIMGSSYAGNETNAAVWTLLGTAPTQGAGASNPTRCLIGGLTIPAGTTCAIYVFNPDVDYTSLSATYSTPEMNLIAGAGLCSQFGGVNAGRVWNGRIYYTSEGCASQRSPFTATVNPNPTVGVNDSTSCGSMTISTAPGYTYVWSTGATSQSIVAASSGIYTVTASDGLCSASDSALITVLGVPTVNIGADTTVCPGQSVSLDAGNPGSNYFWSTGSSTQAISTSQPGITSVLVVDANGCSGTDSIVIAHVAAPVAAFSANSPASNLSFDFTDLSTGSPISWSWDFGDGSSSTLQNPSHVFGSDGSYQVVLIVTNSCGDSDTSSITLGVVGLAGGLAQASMQVLPNPTQGQAVLVFTSSSDMDAVLEVLDVHGKLVLTRPALLRSGENRINLDLSPLSQGLYLVSLKAAGLNAAVKLIRE